jgi:hypothetical protein
MAKEVKGRMVEEARALMKREGLHPRQQQAPTSRKMTL